jgi:poly-gamma-glutamate synthesis protein (capsule biosynthesis protein)
MNPALCFTQPAGHMSVLFAGDLMQHSPQLKAAVQSDGAYAYDTCFSYISDHFHRAHLVIINMETTFAGAPYSGYPLFCSPNELAIAARDAGINVFLTANNHILDRGPRGVKRSVALYDSIGVDHCGTSNKWLLLEHNGIRLGLLNYTYGTNGHRIPKDICLNILDTTAIACDIREVQQAGADFIVCCLHWGVEYSMKPGAEQKRLALWLKNQGTGAVIGSHPHVPQGVDITYDHNGNIEFLTAYHWEISFRINRGPCPEPACCWVLILSGKMAGFKLCNHFMNGYGHGVLPVKREKDIMYYPFRIPVFTGTLLKTNRKFHLLQQLLTHCATL